MFDLHKFSSHQELLDFCHLCHEYKVKRVKVDSEVMKHLPIIAGLYFSNGSFLGIKFTVKE